MLLSVTADAAPRWSRLRAPHCVVLSQLSEEDTRHWATQFEQFVDATRQTMVVDDTKLPPLTVVLFARTKDFATYYRTDASGNPVPCDGYFGSQFTWSVIGMAKGLDHESTRTIIFHEATHWLMTGAATEVPLWLNEGFAEAFSTFAPGEKAGILGQSRGDRAEWLQSHPLAPLRDLVATRVNDRRYTDQLLSQAFYAETWLFVHRLLFADPTKGSEALARHNALRLAGASPVEAFEKTFGCDYGTLERELNNYLHAGRFAYHSIPLPTAATSSASFERAPRLLVETSLARLALSAGQYRLATEHINRARALAPQDPDPLALLALAEAFAEKSAGAATAARQALALGSQDPWVQIILGNDELEQQTRGGVPLGLNARPVAACFVRAAELQPGLRTAYASFAAIAHLLDDPTEEDIHFLETGCHRFPDDLQQRLGLASLLLHRERHREASVLIESTRARAAELPPNLQGTIDILATEADLARQAEHIGELIDHGRFPDATAAVGLFVATPSYAARNAELIAHHAATFRQQIVFGQAQAADRAGNPNEGIQVIDTYLTDPDTPAAVRRQATAIREYLQNRVTQLHLTQDLKRLDELLADGQRNREALALCRTLLGQEIPDNLREQITRRLDTIRFHATLEEAWEFANTDRLDDAIRVLETARYDSAFTEEQQSGIQSTLANFTARRGR